MTEIRCRYFRTEQTKHNPAVRVQFPGIDLAESVERRVEMERLTQWIDENRAIPRVDLKRCGHERCTTQLARYEDLGLTPPEIMELVERDTAKAPEEIQDAFGDGRLICPHCRNSVINYFNRSRPPQFCMICGQRLKWEEN